MNARTRLALVLPLSLVFACSRPSPTPNEASAPKSISTDLPDTGVLGPIKMYWVQDNVLFRGTCADKNFVIKTNCMLNLEVMNYGVFTKKLDNGLAATVQALTNEVESLEAAITVVEGEIATTLVAIDSDEQQIGAAKAELEETRAELGTVRTFIADYKHQLRAIAVRLEQMRDADLAQQASEMAVELQALLGQAHALRGEIGGIIARIDAFKADLKSLFAQLNSLSARLVNLSLDYDRAEAALQLACDDYSSYQETIAMLTDVDGINFRVNADDLKFQKVRRFVKRFEAIFDAAK